MENKSQILIYDDGLQPKTSAGMIKLHECICNITTVHKQDFVKKNLHMKNFSHSTVHLTIYHITRGLASVYFADHLVLLSSSSSFQASFYHVISTMSALSNIIQKW